MLERFQQRSYELENIDKGTYTPEEYEGSLVELRRVNRFLGDASALRSSLLHEINSAGLRSLSVVDFGAGSGYLLRVIAEWARATERSARLVGLELNSRSARAIREEADEFPEITAVQADGLSAPFANNCFDYAISSLTLHHFDDDGAIRILREMSRVARREIFVIDLHRHPLAYFLYSTLGHIILHNRLLREDGALSILRSFKPEELRQLARQAGLQESQVESSFPGRLILRASASVKSFTPHDVAVQAAVETTSPEAWERQGGQNHHAVASALSIYQPGSVVVFPSLQAAL